MTRAHLELASEARWDPPGSQVSPGNPAMLKMDFQGVPGLKERQDRLDTPAPRVPPAPQASATPHSVPTSPALLLLDPVT